MVQSGTAELTINADASSIKRTAGNFITDGFTVGNKITIHNSSNNTAVYTIATFSNDSGTHNVIITEESLSAESAFNGVVLSAETVLWNYNYITDRMEADDSNSPQHTVLLNLRARGNPKYSTGNSFETNRIGLKLESIVIDTSRTLPAYPIPGSGIVTGESRTIGIDLGMATKTLNLTGIITDQRVIRNFGDGDNDKPSVMMTAYEIAQLIHSYIDSSSLQKFQNINELIVLIPSRVNSDYEYHIGLTERTDDSSLTPTADLPLIPFSWRARNPENAGTIYATIPDNDFIEFNPIHSQKEPKGISGFIRNFNCTFTGGQPFIAFTMSFEAANIL